MRAAIVLSLMFCACGTWSNDDIEYLYALPQKDLLKSQLGPASTSQGLRRDPLLGDPVQYFEQANAQSTVFNGFVDGVLTGLDKLRTIPPTTREPNKRTWGPWADDKNPGFDAKVEIVKMSDKTYEWSIQGRKRGDATFQKLAGGTFIATESLRKGRGKFFFDALTAHALYGTMKEKPEDADRVDFGYATDGDPVIVELLVKVPSLAEAVSYEVNRFADTSGVFGFTAGGLPDPNATRISAVYSWNAEGAGQIVYTILAGNHAGASARQCWNVEQKVVYETGNWPMAPTAGNVADCVAVPEQKSLPPFPP